MKKWMNGCMDGIRKRQRGMVREGRKRKEGKGGRKEGRKREERKGKGERKRRDGRKE